MNTYLLGKNDFDFSISYYSGIGYPLDFLELHAHPYHEFSLISDGDITYTSESCMERVIGPCFIFSKAYQLHNPFIEQTHQYARHQIKFQPRLLSSLPEEILAQLSHLTEDSVICRITPSDYQCMHRIVETLLNLFQFHHEITTSLPEYQLLTGALLLIAKDCYLRSTTQSQSNSADSYINTVVQYVKENYAEKITIDSLSERFFVSKTKLSNDFKKQSGMTIGTFLMMTRINHAKVLLKQGYRVERVAQLCGYPGTSFFIKTFKRVTQLTPLKYQQIVSVK